MIHLLSSLGALAACTGLGPAILAFAFLFHVSLHCIPPLIAIAVLAGLFASPLQAPAGVLIYTVATAPLALLKVCRHRDHPLSSFGGTPPETTGKAET